MTDTKCAGCGGQANVRLLDTGHALCHKCYQLHVERNRMAVVDGKRQLDESGRRAS